MSSVNIDQLFEKMSQLKVAVIGDVMLDNYVWGHVERISPEAPVPIVTVDKKEYRIGGASNVALNIASLGASVSMISVVELMMTENNYSSYCRRRILKPIFCSAAVSALPPVKQGSSAVTSK